MARLAVWSGRSDRLCAIKGPAQARLGGTDCGDLCRRPFVVGRHILRFLLAVAAGVCCCGP
jgi:hypothetical protein